MKNFNHADHEDHEGKEQKGVLSRLRVLRDRRGNKNRLNRVTLALFLALGILPLSVPAQDAKPKDQDVVVSVRTSEVILPVTVRNEFGRLTTTLALSDFIVIEDGARQEITSCNARRVPLNVVLLLDVSGSIFTEMGKIREASLAFVRQLSPDDRVCVAQFGGKIELLQDWTGDRDKIERALTRGYRPNNETYFETHLWDALAFAGEKLERVDGRRTIVLLTDCDDNHSTTTESQATAALKRSEAALYVVSKGKAIAEDIKKQYGGFGGAIAGTRGQANALVARFSEEENRMEDIAERTGGRLYRPAAGDDLTKEFGEIAAELARQYVLTYVSSNEAKPGTYRKVTVALAKPGLKAATREGYFVKP